MIELCPISSLMTPTGTAFSASHVANVCRVEWKVMSSGRPDFRRNFRKAWLR